MADPVVVISEIGGACPMQAEGTIDGVPFYFRARGQSWSLSVGGSPVAAPVWTHTEPYGAARFEAGWMEDAVAEGFIRQAAALWAAERRGKGERT